MTFERITLDNFELALNIQEELFPKYNAENNYSESINPDSYYEYYLIKTEDNVVGITGIYYYPQYPDSAWLGWFGIREPYRRNHYGTLALSMFEKLAYEKGFKYTRLYTDKYNNDIAIAFYKSNAYICEDYTNVNDPSSKEYPVLIFSKSLTNQPCSFWDNRNIYLTEQIKKQSRFV